MGKNFEDKWHTPKHIKIERDGEPRGSRRGSIKKKYRRKGTKARMDEIISARNLVERYYEWIQADKKRGPMIFGAYRVWHAEGVQKLQKLLEKALEDDIITEKGAEYVRGDICVLKDG